jgi:zinc/manganese transport system ATP-binding protein
MNTGWHLSLPSDYAIGYLGRLVAKTRKPIHLEHSRDASAITLVCGSNGAGKTTLLRTLSGIIPPLAGTAHFNGTALPVNKSSCVCYLPENLEFLSYLTSFQILNRLGGVDSKEFQVLSEQIRLTPPDAIFRNLSKGNRQKVRFLLAYHLISRYDLILLDEPFSGLDIDTRNIALNMLGEKFRAQNGKRLLVCMHTERLPEGWSDSSLGIYNGIIMSGPGFNSVYDAQAWFYKQQPVLAQQSLQ